MATRSLIGIKLDNEIVKTIYCHWDGYPEGVGQTLVDHYSTPAAITELMELGDVSSLGTSIAKCVAYHRDRKEPYGMVEARDTDASELMSVGMDYGVEFIYVYNNELEWECHRLSHIYDKLLPVDILSGMALN
jgi:hypothetical protein